MTDKPLSETNPTLWEAIPVNQRLREPASQDLRDAYTVRADLVQLYTVDIAEYGRLKKELQCNEIVRSTLHSDMYEMRVKFDKQFNAGMLEGERRARERVKKAIHKQLELDPPTDGAVSLKTLIGELGLDKKENQKYVCDEHYHCKGEPCNERCKIESKEETP